MNRFDDRIMRIRFRRAVAWYLAALAAASIAALFVLGYVFREKLSFAYHYMVLSEKVEKNKLGVDTVKDDLAALAEKSSDLVAVLVLDSANNITFATEDSPWREGETMRLKASGDRGIRLLSDPANPDVSFWLVKNTELAVSGILFSDWDANRKYRESVGRGGKPEDEYFFERNFNSKQSYLLSYVGDRATGDKIYFINDVRPVENSGLYVKLIGAAAMLFFMVYWVLIALWVYADALRSKLHAPIWGVIALFTNLAGLLVYVLYKQNNQTCFRCDAVQDKSHIYCSCCGARLGEICPACKKLVHAGNSFCASCGAELHAEKTEQL